MPITTRQALTLSAILFALPGIALLFTPDEVAGLLNAAAPAPLLQVLGAALLGFASMNWTARGMALGGIYGRAVTAGNQVHTTIGALVLVRVTAATGGTLTMWGLTGVYVLAAIYFSWLMFFSTGRPSPEGDV